MGEYFFPSHYQLGRIYLSGKEDGANMVDVKSATTYLLKANEFGNRLAKTDPSFNKILADCKLFLSQSYYYQLTGKNNSSELGILINAINYCKEAVLLNPNLSQAIYHYAKYISYGISNFNEFKDAKNEKLLLLSFEQCVKIDRNYLRSVVQGDPLYDKVYEPNIGKINELIASMRDEKKNKAERIFSQIKNIVIQLEDKNIAHSQNLSDAFSLAQKQVQLAEIDYNIGTYYGFDNCEINLPRYNQILQELLEKRTEEIQTSNNKLVKYILICIASIFTIYLITVIIKWVSQLSGWEIAGYTFLFLVIGGILVKIFEWFD